MKEPAFGEPHHAVKLDRRVRAERPRQELRVPVRLALQEQHVDRLVDDSKQERLGVIDQDDLAGVPAGRWASYR